MIAWDHRPIDRDAALAALETEPMQLDREAVELPPGQAQTPHGPVWVSTLDGGERTLAWGTHVPAGCVDDGPPRAGDGDTKRRRLASGVDGHIGELPVRLLLPRFGLTRVGRVLRINLGDQPYSLRIRGALPSRAALCRSDDTRVADVTVRLFHRQRLDPDASPEEVVLAHLLTPTYEWLAPRI